MHDSGSCDRTDRLTLIRDVGGNGLGGSSNRSRISTDESEGLLSVNKNLGQLAANPPACSQNRYHRRFVLPSGFRIVSRQYLRTASLLMSVHDLHARICFRELTERG